MKFKVKIFIPLFLIVLTARSQDLKIDTIMHLDTVSISGERYEDFSAGQKIFSLGEAVLQEDQRNNIGNILSENTSVYIRSYGQGNLSTMSFRGTSSAQSGIFWNGINIRMPSLGSADLSMIPATFFNNASVVYGGSSIRYGSGTIGGAVFLSNKADFSGHSSAGVNFRAGSFGFLGAGLSAAISTRKLYFKIAFTGQEARNDFEYNNSRGEKETLNNAQNSSLGFTAHAAALIGNRSQADVFLWYQEALREIPPTTTMNAHEAYLSDRAFRSSLQWKTYFNKGVLNIKTAWFTEYENYTDPLIALQSTINTNTWFFESEYRHQLFRNATIDAGISITAEQADIDAYGSIKNREWIAAFINYKHHFPGINSSLVAGARQELGKSKLSPFTPSIGFEGPLFLFLSHKINISRNYRLPTMNELYWQPGGNPDIKPENSWNAEYSLITEPLHDNEVYKLNFTVTAFSSWVDDWILWLPSNSYWFADNIQKVWARGVELGTGFQISNNNKYADLALSYTYSKSTGEGEDVPGNNAGNQLIYTPLHNASGKIGIGLSSWKLIIYGKYTGESYVTSDNMSVLPGFFLTDLSLRKKFTTKLINIGIGARLNNLLNKDYQVVAYRPMPGRNFQLSISLTFKK